MGIWPEIPSWIFLKIKILFFREILGSQKNESTEMSHILSVPHDAPPPMCSLFYYQHPPPRVAHLLQLMNLLTCHNHTKSIVYSWVNSWCGRFYGFGQICDMYHHYGIKNSFTALKILWALTAHPQPPSSGKN